MRYGWLMILCVVGGPIPSLADDSVAKLLDDLKAVQTEGPASPTARAAWEKLVERGPAALPAILTAMDTPDTVLANWLRTAFDLIVERELAAGGGRIDVAALLRVVEDPRRRGRVRRLALDVVERLRPGTRDRLTPGWLDDPEFRYEAVALLLKEGDGFAEKGDKEQAVARYRKAWSASRDVGQVQALANRLKQHGHSVSLAEHLGFLTEWYVIGPFEANGKGFATSYPPEKAIDLNAELPGKEGPVRWQRYQVKETTTGLPARVALVNLLEPLGAADDAVAYAYTAFQVVHAQEVEFRGAADDNFIVWVNGQRVFAFEEYRNGVRLDRHRFRVKLQPGVNQVLVKICQAPPDPSGTTEPNWEFLLRVVDDTGKGIARKSVLPPP
ncbi:MAG: hypothetical protein NZ700_12005 [Gemmataceae bacterium]|nr:hypothetical protein [Gemmataceae bacterium]MDW8266622.1 hypothetical protein [Gemmataceae bacterium]